MEQCDGQLKLVCDWCDGQGIVGDRRESYAVCEECDGTGIDPNSLYIEVVVRGFYLERRFSPSDAPGS